MPRETEGGCPRRLDIVERAFQGAYIRRQRQIETHRVILAVNVTSNRSVCF